MQNKITKEILSGLMLTLMFACNTQPPAPVVDKEEIKKEIQAKEDEFASLYNGGEMKNIGYYADDATVFYQNQAPLIGKPAIVEFLKSDLQGNTNKISFKTNEVFPSNDGNQVIEVGSYKVVDSTGNAFNTGNYMILFQKRDGKYVSVREMSASDGQKFF